MYSEDNWVFDENTRRMEDFLLVYFVILATFLLKPVLEEVTTNTRNQLQQGELLAADRIVCCLFAYNTTGLSF